jgi:hypothetical protein
MATCLLPRCSQVSGKTTNVPNDRDPNDLAELSRHYDAMLWTVTSLWAGAVGGLLVYSYSGEHVSPWLAAFGLGLTVCAMYFAYSFRVCRRQVHEQMPESLRNLLVSGPGLRQWDVLTLVFLGLIFLWGRLLITHSDSAWWLWLLLALIAAGFVLVMWHRERWPRRV